MKVYILTDDPYHDNEFIYGVFSSLEKAQAAHAKLRLSSKIEVLVLDECRTEMDACGSNNEHIPLNFDPAEVIE